MKSITKADLVKFANRFYGENYVVAYKHIGEDPNRHKVEKPKITPIVVNRDVESEFVTEFKKMESSAMTPKFLDFEKDISKAKLSSGIPFNYVHNKYNNTFTLTYIYDIGTFHDKEMALAFQYLPLLGTDKYTAEELQKEMYALGLSFNVSAGDKRSSVSLSGLEESLEEGMKLLEHIISSVEPDQQKYDEFVNDILKKRMDNKRNKRTILFRGLVSRAKFGENSPFTYNFSEIELKSMDVNKLASKVHSMTGYDHRVFYYGSKEMDEAKKIVEKHHRTEEQLAQVGDPVEFPERDINEGEIYFADYDMVQAEIILVAKDEKFNKELLPYSLVFNEYFGSGLSSIVFQEIREQKALAYSAYSVFRAPEEKDDSHYIYAYVGTQADKLGDAIKEIKRLLNDMPEVEEQFQGSKESAIKKLETDWITKASIYWSFESAKRRGLDYDVRKDNYDVVKGMEMEDLRNFFNDHIKGKDYALCVIGSKDNVDFDVLGEYGTVKELSLEEIFNY
ncbi:MAG: insulinase family protein [Chitinophagales bacterium]|nr:insulinase family protein [Chitinophagales bacterium]